MGWRPKCRVRPGGLVLQLSHGIVNTLGPSLKITQPAGGWRRQFVALHAQHIHGLLLGQSFELCLHQRCLSERWFRKLRSSSLRDDFLPRVQSNPMPAGAPGSSWSACTVVSLLPPWQVPVISKDTQVKLGKNVAQLMIFNR